MQRALCNGQLVWAINQTKALNCQYRCPDCGQKVHLCDGSERQPYFAHYAKTKCDGEETAIHQLGKRQIAQWLVEQGYSAKLEVYLPPIQQRPDVLTQINHQKIALEFQCSPLSLKRIQERNFGYRSLGIKYRWFLGPTYQHHLRANKMAQFLQSYQGSLVLPYWNLKTAQPNYVTVPNQQNKNVWFVITKQTKQIQCQIKYRNPQIIPLVSQAYLQGHLCLSACPLVAHETQISWPLMKSSPFTWRIKILLTLERLPINWAWTEAEWLVFLAQQTKWLALPCLREADVNLIHQTYLWCFTQELIFSGIISRQKEKLILIQKPRWFESYEAKIKYLNQLIQNAQR